MYLPATFTFIQVKVILAVMNLRSYIKPRKHSDDAMGFKPVYDLYQIHFMSFSSYNGYKLNSHLTCFQQGFIAQSVEHRTGIAEGMGSNPIGASEFLLGFICNSFITERITFIYLYSLSTVHSYDLYHNTHHVTYIYTAGDKQINLKKYFIT